ncbi:hypothetical protein ACFYW6_29640 [Streptomyces sp. NPDC002659]
MRHHPDEPPSDGSLNGGPGADRIAGGGFGDTITGVGLTAGI